MKKLLGPVCLVVLVASVLLVASCGQQSTSSSSTPTQVVTANLEAMKKGDWNAEYDLFSADNQKKITRQQWVYSNTTQTTNPAAENAGLSWQVMSEKVTGDKGVVVVKTSIGGQSQNFSFVTVKEGGKWKIDYESSQQLNQAQPTH